MCNSSTNNSANIVSASHPVFESNLIDPVSRHCFTPGVMKMGAANNFLFSLAGDESDPDPVVTVSES